jgi:RNA polymerase sigma-70 factor, ECF subfamily
MGDGGRGVLTGEGRRGKKREVASANCSMLESAIAEPPRAVLPPAPHAAPTYPRRVIKRTLEERAAPREESAAWLASLRSEGADRHEAIARLHELMLKAARFELGRRQAALSHVRGEELEDLATQAADDALVALLGKLDDFRGTSRFTTWAYKFALLEAGVKLRRRAWQDREVVLEPDDWQALADTGSPVHERLERSERLSELRAAIEDELTPHQRRVFVALALNEVPIDVVAERLDTTRGALYKTLHDARRKLREALERREG